MAEKSGQFTNKSEFNISQLLQSLQAIDKLQIQQIASENAQQDRFVKQFQAKQDMLPGSYENITDIPTLQAYQDDLKNLHDKYTDEYGSAYIGSDANDYYDAVYGTDGNSGVRKRITDIQNFDKDLDILYKSNEGTDWMWKNYVDFIAGGRKASSQEGLALQEDILKNITDIGKKYSNLHGNALINLPQYSKHKVLLEHINEMQKYELSVVSNLGKSQGINAISQPEFLDKLITAHATDDWADLKPFATLTEELYNTQKNAIVKRIDDNVASGYFAQDLSNKVGLTYNSSKNVWEGFDENMVPKEWTEDDLAEQLGVSQQYMERALADSQRLQDDHGVTYQPWGPNSNLNKTIAGQKITPLPTQQAEDMWAAFKSTHQLSDEQIKIYEENGWGLMDITHKLDDGLITDTDFIKSPNNADGIPLPTDKIFQDYHAQLSAKKTEAVKRFTGLGAQEKAFYKAQGVDTEALFVEHVLAGTLPQFGTTSSISGVTPAATPFSGLGDPEKAFIVDAYIKRFKKKVLLTGAGGYSRVQWGYGNTVYGGTKSLKLDADAEKWFNELDDAGRTLELKPIVEQTKVQLGAFSSIYDTLMKDPSKKGVKEAQGILWNMPNIGGGRTFRDAKAGINEYASEFKRLSKEIENRAMQIDKWDKSGEYKPGDKQYDKVDNQLDKLMADKLGLADILQTLLNATAEKIKVVK